MTRLYIKNDVSYAGYMICSWHVRSFHRNRKEDHFHPVKIYM